MKSKDKQIRELEIKFKWAFIGFVVMSILALIIGGFFDYYEAKSERLESQLQSCQEKVPVWTLKVECNYSPFVNSKSAFIYTEINFTDYQDYLESLEAVEQGESGENCEVLP